MTRLTGLVRGLLHRGGTAVMIFAAALVASAAAATGPAYYAAAKTSILHDTVAGASYLGRGFEADQTGAVNMASYSRGCSEGPLAGCSYGK